VSSRPPIGSEPGRLRVLDLGRLLAGPVVATLLGDLGAEVIKVEHPNGGDTQRLADPQVPDDPAMSYAWQVESRNKRAITLKLSDDRGRDLLLQLAQWADVLVENFRPGVMDRWQVGYEDVRKVNRRLVYVSVSGYGQSGPYRERPGLDFVGSGFAGLTYVTGSPDSPPTVPGYPLSDYMAGAFGALGALEAVRRRDGPDGTGEGEHVDVALYEPALRFSTPWLSLYGREGRVREREGAAPRLDDTAPSAIWGYSYRARDGRWVSLIPVLQDVKKQHALFEVIGRGEWATAERFTTRDLRAANYKEIDAAIREWCAARDARDVLDALDRLGIPGGPINSVADIAVDPHMRERSIREVPDHRGDPLLMPEVVPRLIGNPGTIRWTGEELGASNEEVYLGLLGIDRGEYDELRTDGVI
jgi:crotonobetainyl-CoA:carnitine CoA-transferase CaiB-like acyl-CoA transferase